MSIPGLYQRDKWSKEPVYLEDFNVHATFINNNVDVTCNFTYQNKKDELINTEFEFPLESTAAVHHFEAIIGEKRLLAQCRERIEAESIYKEATEAGHTAFMMQENYRMGDAFMMKLGNIPANETVKLIFKYVVPLFLRQVDTNIERFSALKEPLVSVFSMPSKLADRYDPNPQESALFNSANVTKKMQFTAEIYADGGILSVTSAVHKFDLKYMDENKRRAKVVLVGGRDLTHDFELELVLQNAHAFSAPCEMGRSDKGGFLGYNCVAATFLPDIHQSPISDGDKREIIFVVDRSESMSGSRISKTKEALLLFLKSLPRKCRFQIVGFGDTFTSLFPHPVDYTKKNLDRALKYQSELDADMGWTEVLPALKSVYKKRITGKGWSRQIIFLTDGEIKNQDEVIGLVLKNQSTARLFAIGLGDEVSTSLIWGVARAGRGTAAFIRNADNLQAATMSILRCALQPMLSDVQLKWDVKVDGSPAEILSVPSQLPPPFSGVYLTAFGLFCSAGESKTPPHIEGSLTLSYKQDDGKVVALTTPIESLPMEHEDLGLHRLAAKAQIFELVDRHSSLSDAKPKAEVRQQIVDISTNANVISPFTSFVAVDPDKQERVKPPAPPLQHIEMDYAVDYCAAWSFQSAAMPKSANIPHNFDQCEARLFQSASISRASSRRLNLNQCRDARCEMDTSINDREIAIEMQSDDFDEGSFYSNNSDEFGDKMKSGAKTKKLLNFSNFKIGSKAKSSINVDEVALTASLQDFDGFWKADEDVANLLHIKLTQLISSKPIDVKDARIWATVMVIAYLQTRLASRKDEWQMVVEKAMAWLSEQKEKEKEKKKVEPEQQWSSDPNALIEKARVLLLSLLSKTE